MENEENNQTKDTPPAKLDIWDRLIKLEKRNSQLSMFHDSNCQTPIEEEKEKALFWWPENQVDKNIRSFWKQINETYFKASDDLDVSSLDQLISFLGTPSKAVSVKYTDSDAYETFKAVISDSYKHQHPDPTLNYLNLRNLQKQYYITLLQADSANGLISNIPSFSEKNKEANLQDHAKSHNTHNFLRNFLNKESEKLKSLISQTRSKIKTGNDEVSLELEELSDQNTKLNQENQNYLFDLKEKVLKSENIKCTLDEKNSSTNFGSITRKKSSNPQISCLDSSDISQTQLIFLHNLIIKLENQQTAETIRCVIDCRKTEYKGYQFCVLFDEGITSERFWIEESVLQELDKLRERSLFGIYDIPQKIKRCTYASNILGFEYCNKKSENIQALKNRQHKWKELMKERLNEEIVATYKEKLQDKLAQMGYCHNCRHLFPEDALVKCNYKDSIVNFQISRANLKNKKDTKNKKPDDSQKPLWDERRQAYLFYQIHDGEISCYRMFCRLCLKMNQEVSAAQNSEISNFICPFCKKSCCCTRCTRNEHIDKFRTLYVSLGGDLANIKEESYFERFICQYDTQIEDITNQKRPFKFLAKTLPKYALKPTKGKKSEGSVINTKYKIEKYKQNAKKLKFMKNLRIQMEKGRMLCSQVAKRESVKMHLSFLRKELFNIEVNQIFNLTGKKREGPDFGKKISDEPAIIKKVKNEREKSKFQSTKKVAIEYKRNQEEQKEERNRVKLSTLVKKRGRPRKEVPPPKISLYNLEKHTTSPSSERSSSLKRNSARDISLKMKQKTMKSGIKKTPRPVNTINDKSSKTLSEMRGRQNDVKKDINVEVSKASPSKKQTKSRAPQMRNNNQKDRHKRSSSKEKITNQIENIGQTGLKQKKQNLQNAPDKLQKRRSSKVALLELAMEKSPLKITKQNSSTPRNGKNQQIEKSPLLKKELHRILDCQPEDQFEVFNTTRGLGRMTRNSNNKNKLRNNKKYHYSQNFQN